ncbi:MAG: hypothetical protein JXJ30_08845, partial [Halothiobacillaceae bacterium]|nr:hypothetical protein [Halothiobacillaceae bacterium]
NDALAQASRPAEPLRLAAYDVVEGRLPDGHPYYPGYKSRVGFTPADNRKFGPEFGGQVRPIWLAVRRELAATAVSSRIAPESILAACLKTQRPEFDEAIEAAGGRPDDYFLLPVHPWQWQAVVLPAFAAELTDGRFIYLGKAATTYYPQQSIRTLADAAVPEAPSLKLALSIRNTSTARTLAPHTVRNAALISDWLKGLAADDPYLRDWDTVLLGEVLGEGRLVFGLFCSVPAPLVVEMIAAAGFDFVILDTEHTLTSPERLEHLIRAADAAGIVSLVRVPQAPSPMIVQVLDAGAAGADRRTGRGGRGFVPLSPASRWAGRRAPRQIFSPCCAMAWSGSTSRACTSFG